jgi:hypothetical protein
MSKKKLYYIVKLLYYGILDLNNIFMLIYSIYYLYQEKFKLSKLFIFLNIIILIFLCSSTNNGMLLIKSNKENNININSLSNDKKNNNTIGLYTYSMPRIYNFLYLFEEEHNKQNIFKLRNNKSKSKKDKIIFNKLSTYNKNKFYLKIKNKHLIFKASYFICLNCLFKFFFNIKFNNSKSILISCYLFIKFFYNVYESLINNKNIIRFSIIEFIFKDNKNKITKILCLFYFFYTEFFLKLKKYL